MIDWPRLIARLCRKVPRSTIAELCGHSPSWISKLTSGEIDQPKHDEGERLIRLYREKVCKEISDLQKIHATTV
jgi:hypothetical protein